MKNTTTAPAERTYIVWADRRCFQQVQASSPEQAFAAAQKYPGDFEPCSNGIENFEMHPVVADLDSDEEFTVGPVPDLYDARLIAAAPDLLRACREVLAELKRQGFFNEKKGEGTSFAYEIGTLQRAIAKAAA